MTTQSPSTFGPEFRYILDCILALEDKRYSDAARLLDEGLRRDLSSPEQVDAMALLKHLSNLVTYMSVWLEEALEIHSDERVVQQLEREIRCSFCGDIQSETKKVIAGPGVYICADCVKNCVDILAN